MTFKDYLAARKVSYDAQGDFVRLAKADATMPEVTSLSELTAHLAARGMPYNLVEAACLVWADHQKQVKRALTA